MTRRLDADYLASHSRRLQLCASLAWLFRAEGAMPFCWCMRSFSSLEFA